MTLLERLARFVHGTLLMDSRYISPRSGTFAEVGDKASFEIDLDTKDPRLGTGRLRITVEVID